MKDRPADHLSYQCSQPSFFRSSGELRTPVFEVLHCIHHIFFLQLQEKVCRGYQNNAATPDVSSDKEGSEK